MCPNIGETNYFHGFRWIAKKPDTIKGRCSRTFYVARFRVSRVMCPWKCVCLCARARVCESGRVREGV